MKKLKRNRRGRIKLPPPTVDPGLTCSSFSVSLQDVSLEMKFCLEQENQQLPCEVFRDFVGGSISCTEVATMTVCTEKEDNCSKCREDCGQKETTIRLVVKALRPMCPCVITKTLHGAEFTSGSSRGKEVSLDKEEGKEACDESAVCYGFKLSDIDRKVEQKVNIKENLNNMPSGQTASLNSVTCDEISSTTCSKDNTRLTSDISSQKAVKQKGLLSDTSSLGEPEGTSPGPFTSTHESIQLENSTNLQGVPKEDGNTNSASLDDRRSESSQVLCNSESSKSFLKCRDVESSDTNSRTAVEEDMNCTSSDDSCERTELTGASCRKPDTLDINLSNSERCTNCLQCGPGKPCQCEDNLHCNICGKDCPDCQSFEIHMTQHKLDEGVCLFCDSSFKHKSDLKTHLKSVHSDKKAYQCDVCEKSFRSLCALRLHSRVHSGVRPFQCDLCGKTYTNSSALRSHGRCHVTVKTFQCNLCDKSFFLSTELKSHSTVHSGERPFHCTECHGKFRTKQLLSKHMKLHTGKKTHLCKFCPMSFFSVWDLQNHSTTHTGNKKFKCEECDSTFTVKSSLKKHLLLHIQEKPFKCEVCQKEYASKIQLRKHSKLHNTDNPYVCEHCGKELTTKHYLKSHMKTHVGYEKVECYVCGKKYRELAYLKIHMKSHTGEGLVKCELCGENFADPKYLTVHKSKFCKANKVACDECGREFANKRDLSFHVDIHTGKRPHECEVCGKGFPTVEKLSVHKRRHNDSEKTFECGVCSKRFVCASDFNKHKRCHIGKKRRLDLPYKLKYGITDFNLPLVPEGSSLIPKGSVEESASPGTFEEESIKLSPTAPVSTQPTNLTGLDTSHMVLCTSVKPINTLGSSVDPAGTQVILSTATIDALQTENNLSYKKTQLPLVRAETMDASFKTPGDIEIPMNTRATETQMNMKAIPNNTIGLIIEVSDAQNAINPINPITATDVFVDATSTPINTTESPVITTNPINPINATGISINAANSPVIATKPQGAEPSGLNLGDIPVISLTLEDETKIKILLEGSAEPNEMLLDIAGVSSQIHIDSLDPNTSLENALNFVMSDSDKMPSNPFITYKFKSPK